MTTVGSGTQLAPVAKPSDSDLDQFVYHISHDLRASMRALVLVPGWIEEDLREQMGGVPASIQEHVKLLKDQAGRLDGMMKDLLTFSRVGRMQTLGVVHLSDTIDRVLEELDLPEGFEVIRDLSTSQMTGWPVDIKTLFFQLISNVVKHAGTKVRLSTRQNESGVTLRVSDDGPGIDPKFHDRIFEMMTTLKPRDEVEGSGLGLAIARKIMAIHGGTIEVASDGLGNGTEFTAFFPTPPRS